VLRIFVLGIFTGTCVRDESGLGHCIAEFCISGTAGACTLELIMDLLRPKTILRFDIALLGRDDDWSLRIER
jgi:hypothetical protein